MIDYGDIQERPLDPPDEGFIEFCTKCGEEFTTDYLADPLICDSCRREALLTQPIPTTLQDELDRSLRALDKMEEDIAIIKKAILARRQA